ncbi:MAG: ABC transporter substrate-binding protein [Chloroflexota bacterium]
MSFSDSTRRVSRRQVFQMVALAGGGALLAACTQPAAPAATPGASGTKAAAGTQAPGAGSAKPLAGQSIKCMLNTIAYTDGLKANLADLEGKTGIKAELDAVSFAILNQRGDQELSSASGAYDVMQMVFIRAGRWIGAGWAEPLDNFMSADEKSDLSDFVSGTRVPFTVDGKTYAIPWLADSTVVGYRKDVFEKAGYAKFPETYDDLQVAAQKIHTPEVAAFVTQDNMHWIYPNWLQSYGGNFFKDPPKDLTPQFNTPEAIKAAEMFTTMMSKYGAPGIGKLDTLAAIAVMQQGKGAMYLDGLGNVQQIIDTTKGQFANQMVFVNTPKGPSGHFPQLAVHGYLINKASKKKEAAWQFIKWATSKEMMLKMALEKNHIAGTRASVINNADVKKKFTWQGSDMAALHLSVMERAGSGYMAYRTVPQFPPIGDRVAIAMTAITSGQATAADEMRKVQTDAIGILQKEGIQVKV